MESSKRLIAGVLVVVALMSGAWMMGKKSATNSNVAGNGFGPVNTFPSGSGPQAPVMNSGAGAASAAAPYGANPGADMSGSGGQMAPAAEMAQSGPAASSMQQSPMGQTGEMSEGQQYGGGATGGNQYQDPRGQFTIKVPSGWQSVPQNGGVVITRGASMVVVSPFDGAQSGEQIVSAVARQYGSQWSSLQVSDQGQFAIGGAPAAYMMMSGRSPRGVQSLLRVAGTVRGNQGFAIIISTPLSEFNSVSPELQSIESSLAFGSGN